MLGSNPDVWNQARGLIAEGLVQVVAVIPGTPPERFAPARVLVWQPPEDRPDPAVVNCVQAENQPQWDANVPVLEQVAGARAIVLNRWDYGHFPVRTVALVEMYATDGPVDYGTPKGEMFARYMRAGASAVVAVPGLYPNRRPVDQAAADYRNLPADLPGIMGYAGEDMIDSVLLDAMRDVWARYR